MTDSKSNAPVPAKPVRVKRTSVEEYDLGPCALCGDRVMWGEADEYAGEYPLCLEESEELVCLDCARKNDPRHELRFALKDAADYVRHLIRTMNQALSQVAKLRTGLGIKPAHPSCLLCERSEGHRYKFGGDLIICAVCWRTDIPRKEPQYNETEDQEAVWPEDL